MTEKVYENPDIYRVKVYLPNNPLHYLNAYIVKIAEHNLIIDTGFRLDECREELFSALSELNIELSKASLFLTHLHSDHTGLACELADKGTKIFMSKIDHTMLSSFLTTGYFKDISSLLISEGYPADELAIQAETNPARRYSPRCPFDAVLLEDGQSLPLGGLNNVVIHTPGHTPGHMTLYLSDQKILFSGDHILFSITPNIATWGADHLDLADYRNSLKRIRRLPIDVTFPAHRETTGDVYTRIDELLVHHERRLEEIYEVIASASDGINAYSIASCIKWSARGLEWSSFPPHQRWFAVTETLAHLYDLVACGRIQREMRGGVYQYSVASV